MYCRRCSAGARIAEVRTYTFERVDLSAQLTVSGVAEAGTIRSIIKDEENRRNKNSNFVILTIEGREWCRKQCEEKRRGIDRLTGWVESGSVKCLT